MDTGLTVRFWFENVESAYAMAKQVARLRGATRGEIVIYTGDAKHYRRYPCRRVFVLRKASKLKEVVEICGPYAHRIEVLIGEIWYTLNKPKEEASGIAHC